MENAEFHINNFASTINRIKINVISFEWNHIIFNASTL